MDQLFQFFATLGLSPAEVSILQDLYAHGRSKAIEITKRFGQTRGYIYAILSSLKEKGLILEIQGKQTLYEPAPPSALNQLAQREVQKAMDVQSLLSTAIIDWQKQYESNIGKPSIEVFSGFDGAALAIQDSLNQQETIRTIIDLSALSGEFAIINKKQLKKRLSLGIEKRILLDDTVEARVFVQAQGSSHTTWRFLSNLPARHQTAVEIYDSTVLFITLDRDPCLSVLLRDSAIAQFHKGQFDFLWNLAVE